MVPFRKKKPKKLKEEKPTKVKAVLLQSDRGYSTLRKVDVLNGEMIQDPDDENKSIYTGMLAEIFEIHSSVLPSRLSRMFIPKIFRLKGYFRVGDQPFTRSPYTGEVLDSDKKRSVLLERGIIDKEGYYLDVDGKRHVEDSCWIKVDVSNIDFIAAEFHAYEQSKNNQKMASAMSKTGAMQDRIWMWITLFLCAGWALTVIVLSGALNG